MADYRLPSLIYKLKYDSAMSSGSWARKENKINENKIIGLPFRRKKKHDGEKISIIQSVPAREECIQIIS